MSVSKCQQHTVPRQVRTFFTVTYLSFLYNHMTSIIMGYKHARSLDMHGWVYTSYICNNAYICWHCPATQLGVMALQLPTTGNTSQEKNRRDAFLSDWIERTSFYCSLVI